MKKHYLALLSLFLVTALHAEEPAKAAQRTMQFSNDKVQVWKTIIYPKSTNALPMHRHEHDRVLVALTDGLLKITNNKGKVHYMKLEKDKAYYLSKDIPNEVHNDVNMSKHSIKVMIIELAEGKVN